MNTRHLSWEHARNLLVTGVAISAHYEPNQGFHNHYEYHEGNITRIIETYGIGRSKIAEPEDECRRARFYVKLSQNDTLNEQNRA